jgi:cytochrome c2
VNLKHIKYLVVFGFAVLEMYGCKENRKVSDAQVNTIVKHSLDLQKGRALYQQKCQSCHNYHSQNNEYYPALHQMIQLENNTLLQKLKVLEIDSLHKAVISWKNETEMQTLKHFISTYDGIDP